MMMATKMMIIGSNRYRVLVPIYMLALAAAVLGLVIRAQPPLVYLPRSATEKGAGWNSAF
jgi:hypothetical protein